MPQEAQVVPLKINLVGSDVHFLKPYDLQLTKITDGDQIFNGAWYCCHHCKTDILIRDHKIENNNGIITITPSLVCPTENCKGHYWIRNGEIVES